VDIGDEKLQEFYRDWEKKFAEFEDESMIRIEELKYEHEEQMELLNIKLDRAVEAAKIKPSAKLKEMQNNEKLVAVNERVEEAMNYRKELKILEIKEAQRIENLR
jgi:histone deacetylase complex regulatory component SIN3